MKGFFGNDEGKMFLMSETTGIKLGSFHLFVAKNKRNVQVCCRVFFSKGV